MTEKKKILICDDEEGIRESLKLILGNEYNLIETSNAAECLTQVKENKDIKAVLIDIKMPKQNGIEATKEIKRIRPDLKVIIVTGYASAEIAQEALAAGADEYIPKPFESSIIMNKIMHLISLN